MAHVAIILLVAIGCQYISAAPPTIEVLENRLTVLGKKLDAVMRQMMLQQLFVEERIRTSGDSGVKQTRVTTEGTRPYHSSTHMGAYLSANIAGIPHLDRNMGVNAPVVVMNGVEFRAKYDWAKLRMPHRTSKSVMATEDIPLPDVPPEVLSQKTVQAQVKEMQEWFKAWKTGDFRKRDFRKYFKPVLCYLEGTWLKGNKQADGTPFDAYFQNVQDKFRFQSYSGSMPDYDKYPWLPTTIQEIQNGTTPVFAQWYYRHVCHPVQKPILLNRFILTDDLATRVSRGLTYGKYAESMFARFRLNPRDSSYFRDGFASYTFLDDIMAEIPGMDNYRGNLTDDTFDLPAYGFKPNAPVLNSAFYHRWYKVKRRGAMGLTTRHRGYSDNCIFMAQNSQSRSSSMKLEDCTGRGKARKCNHYTQSWSYAIPMFVTYMTPLSKWNPYNVKIHNFNDNNAFVKVVKENGARNGGATEQKAFNGASCRGAFYLTPKEFYTTTRSKGVLDQKGQVHLLGASGQDMFVRNIGAGVGSIRQTYPIYPVHGEGATAWKELLALEDVVMDQKKFLNLYRSKP